MQVFIHGINLKNWTLFFFLNFVLRKLSKILEIKVHVIFPVGREKDVQMEVPISLKPSLKVTLVDQVLSLLPMYFTDFLSSIIGWESL